MAKESDKIGRLVDVAITVSFVAGIVLGAALVIVIIN